MKFSIPEISWHNRDPVLSVDFQPKSKPYEPLRLASGGTDSHVLIWYVTTTENGTVNLEVAADLTRHQKAVNVVRWSPNGQYLASGDDESIIIIWKQKTDVDPTPIVEQGEEQYKETWVIYKTLRGHMEDVLDISWSPNSEQLASGSVDNKLIIWDVARGRNISILSDHKGFVQGVAWDPKEQFIATTSTDRVFRTFDVATKKVVSRSSKAVLPFPPSHPLHNVKARLYHDDTLQTFYRRLHFSPDGLLIAVPAGKIEPEQGKFDMKPINAIYIYTRYSLKVPACVIPCGEAARAVRWSPRRYAPRATGPPSSFPTPARAVLAVAAGRSLLIYDTQQKTPLAVIANIHYTRLTDLTWSPDGRTLIVSSTDGFCSIVSFTAGELGEVLPDDFIEPQPCAEPMEVQTEGTPTKETVKEKYPEESKSTTPKIDSFIKFKAPIKKSPKKRKTEPNQPKTPVKIDILMETAMPSWSDNSNSEIIKSKQIQPMDTEDMKECILMKPDVIELEDSEDIKLVYEGTETNNMIEKQSPEGKTKESPKKCSPIQANTPTSSKNSDNNSFLNQAKVTDVKESPVVASQSPRAPRRVSFVTLSSPKNTKKKC